MAASSDEALAAPIVFQCGACHRVLSDSNQLLAAVAELGLLVLDAVVGVRIGEPEPLKAEAFVPLHCSACEHLVGRLYQQPPEPSLASLVHSNESPRYALVQGALASYVLGSAAAHQLQPADASAAAAAEPRDADAAAAPNGDAHGALQPPHAMASRLAALESGEQSAREQRTQLMRVVLALEQRIQALERERGGAGS